MRKVVINGCYGGFGLSELAEKLYSELSGKPVVRRYCFDSADRDDPILIQLVEQLGEKVNGQFAKLRVVEIPEDVNWQINEYDGNEWIAEVHRTWG